MTDVQAGGAPRISRRRAAITVAAGLLPVGALVGALWAWLAPPVKGAVALTHSGERVHEYLGSEADHFFVAAFLMLGLLNVVAAVAAVLAWQWRPHRGPGMVAGLCTGVVIAACDWRGRTVGSFTLWRSQFRRGTGEPRPPAVLRH
jgi:hypothetical protein